ncbi:MAG: ATP synthase F1 subunit delta [Bacteroidales bacterium]|nr:ATP synthase F1 subunit delta [Bacteroidales bacterium]
MVFSTISLRYATALIELSNERQITDNVYSDMLEMQHLLFESEELRNFLRTPQVDDKTKSRLIHKLFSEHFQEITVRFFTLLIRKGRSKLLIYIVHQFVELYRKQNGIVSALVKTAVNLPEAAKQQIIEKVRQATGKTQIELTEHIDKSLLGGFILYYNGNCYNASVKHNLEKIRNILTA